MPISWGDALGRSYPCDVKACPFMRASTMTPLPCETCIGLCTEEGILRGES
jgi:hypothetical protein